MAGHQARPAVLRPFSLARAWRPAAGARLARMLGLAKNASGMPAESAPVGAN